MSCFEVCHSGWERLFRFFFFFVVMPALLPLASSVNVNEWRVPNALPQYCIVDPRTVSSLILSTRWCQGCFFIFMLCFAVCVLVGGKMT